MNLDSFFKLGHCTDREPVFSGTFFLNGNNYVCIYDRIDQVRALHAQ